MKKNIDGVIFSYVVQIIIAIIFMIVSYFIFTNSRLSELGQVAHAYDTMNIDLMTNYVIDNDTVMDNENLLGKGTLSIKNPNKRNANAETYLLVSDNAKLNTVKFIVNGLELDTNNASLESGYYVIKVEDYKMVPFEDKTYDLEIEGNPFYTTAFDYKFDVKESFM